MRSDIEVVGVKLSQQAVTISVLFLFGAIFTIGAVSNSQDVNKYLIVYLGVYLCILAFNSSSPLFIISALFCSTYFIFLWPAFLLDIRYAARPEYQDPKIDSLNLRYLAIFCLIFFGSWYLTGSRYFSAKRRIRRFENPLLYWGFLLTILGLTGLSINSTGTILSNSYAEVSGDRYAFIDYAIVFCLLCFVYSKTPFKQNLLVAVCAIYVCVSLLYGLRLRSIQMMLMIFLLFYEDKFSPKSVKVITFVGLFFLQAFERFRSGIEFSSFYELLGIENGVMSANQGGVFLNANMFIGLTLDGFIDAETRLKTFLGNFISIFKFTSSVAPEYSLPAYTKTFFDVPGGGLISGYMYVWGGAFGLISLGLFITFLYLKAFSSTLNQMFLVYSVIAITTIPRWFAYNPIHFWKMGFWVIALYVSSRIAHQIITPGRKFVR